MTCKCGLTIPHTQYLCLYCGRRKMSQVGLRIAWLVSIIAAAILIVAILWPLD
jgi:hypothetical protein